MARLTVSVDARVVECAKRYAARHATSVSRLVACYLDLLTRPPRAADTLLRWARRGATPEESSGRVMRLARVGTIAEDVLGSREKARRWLQKPNPALAGAVPLEQLDTELGARRVEGVLGRIAHGVVG